MFFGEKGFFYLKTRPSPIVVTVLSVAAVGFLKMWLNKYFDLESPILLFFSAVTLSAWYGGFRQGFLATILALSFTTILFTQHTNTPLWWNKAWAFRTFFYFMDCMVISFVCSALRISKRKIQKAIREHEKIRKLLTENEQGFQKIFDSNAIGLLFSDTQGRVYDANKYFLDLIGYDKSDLVQGAINWKKLTPPEYLEISEKAVRDISRTGSVEPFEKEYLHKDGTRVPVAIGSARFGEERYATFVLDIRATKKVELALQQSNSKMEKEVQKRTAQLQLANEELKNMIEAYEKTSEQMRQSQSFMDSVIENIPNMIFVKDAKDLRFVRFNRAGEALLGYNRDSLMGKNDYDFFPKNEADAFTEKDRAVLDAGIVIDIPEEPISTTFGLRFLHTKKIPILDRYGKPQYLLGISEDITERKEIENQKLTLVHEQAARLEAEKIAERLKFLSRASATLNESLDIQSTLNSFADTIVNHMADWCRIDILGNDDNEPYYIWAYKDVEKTGAAYEGKWDLESWAPKAVKLGQSELYSEVTEEWMRERKGDFLSDIHSVMIVPLISYGKIVGTITFVSTDSTKTYGELDLSLAEDLAKRAFFAVENARLFKKAHEANRAKSAFLANMSHEIRTPLGAMLGFAEILSEENNLSSEQYSSVKTIKRNGQQLLRLVDEILDISKVESERIYIEKVSFSLTSLIEDILTLLAQQASEKGIDFNVYTDPNLPERIISDPTRLRQILINVVGNAIKFTQKGGVTINIRDSEGVSDEKRRLHFIIEDTGIGISPDQEKRLFQPFMQADSSTTRRFGGTGLGLYLSRKLALLLGGDLVLSQSSLGQGSCFTLTIEAGLPAEKEEKLVGKSVSGAPKIQRQFVGKKVLIVDDAADNRALIQLFIARLGLEIDMAESGAEAIQKALKHRYDVILMDIQMPGMDGFEAVAKLRASNYHDPVIAITAHAMKGDRENCIRNGFDDYLCKPVTRDGLYNCLIRYLERGDPSRI